MSSIAHCANRLQVARFEYDTDCLANSLSEETLHDPGPLPLKLRYITWPSQSPSAYRVHVNDHWRTVLVPDESVLPIRDPLDWTSNAILDHLYHYHDSSSQREVYYKT